PMTLDYHMNGMDLHIVMKEAVKRGERSHQTSTCGLHIHVNRNAFGDNKSEQEEVISRILFFVEKNWNEIFKFSRRNSYNMNRWSARYGFEKTGKEILDKAKNSSNGRYVAVNLSNYHTIEFRLFRGTPYASPYQL
ncbi:MAG: zinc-binding protein, partial [Ruminococcus sp.]